MDNKLTMVAIIIHDILVTAIFAGVAIIFHKWWIILFSILSGMEYKSERKINDGDS